MRIPVAADCFQVSAVRHWSSRSRGRQCTNPVPNDVSPPVVPPTEQSSTQPRIMHAAEVKERDYAGKCHRDVPVENDDWFTREQPYRAACNRPRISVARVSETLRNHCMCVWNINRQENTAEVVPATVQTVPPPWRTQCSCASLQQKRRLGSKRNSWTMNPSSVECLAATVLMFLHRSTTTRYFSKLLTWRLSPVQHRRAYH